MKIIIKNPHHLRVVKKRSDAIHMKTNQRGCIHFTPQRGTATIWYTHTNTEKKSQSQI